MNNWILKKLDHAQIPQKAIALWKGDPSSLQLINDAINVVYRFESQGEGRYLRMTHPKIRTLKQLNSAIDYQNHLFLNSAPVCQPILSNHGNYIERIKQETMIFYAHVNHEVPGKIIDIKRDDIDVHQAWGKALAQLHHAALSYRPSHKHHFFTWQDLWKEIAKDIKKENKAIQQAYVEMDSFLKTLGKTSTNFGLTHGDHRGANALYDGKQVHIIDFDEPVYHWFAADIACPFLCSEPFALWRSNFFAFLDGYRSIRNLSEEDIQTISELMRMKNLGLYTWTKNNWHHSQVPGGYERKTWLANVYRLIAEPVNLFEEKD